MESEEQAIARLEAEIAERRKELDEIKAGIADRVKLPKPDRFALEMPTEGELYWITQLQGVTDFLWDNGGHDRGQFALGNCYSSSDRAQAAYDQQLLKTKLDRAAMKLGGSVTRVYNGEALIGVYRSHQAAMGWWITKTGGSDWYFTHPQTAQQFINENLTDITQLK